MEENELTPMTAESVKELLEVAGAEAMIRAGRSDSYGAPREFSFEVRGIFPNGMGLHIQARQYTYRDPWEAKGRVNDFVDVSLLRNGEYSPLPKGYTFFQERDQEEDIDYQQLEKIINDVSSLNPRIYQLQELTGDMS